MENEELKKIIRNNKDVLFVCAAGNRMTDLTKEKIYPASYSFSNLISVMAIDNTGSPYSCSGYGKLVDIAAPGTNIKVTVCEGDTTYVDGTSIAASYVTAASLLKSSKPSATPQDIKRYLIENTKKIEKLKGSCSASGCLDIGLAMRAIWKGR